RVVMERPGGGWTIYAGELLEEDRDAGGGLVGRRSYYYHGSRRVALRQSAGAVTFIHGDHLGSTSLTTDGNGGSPVRQWYEPYGEVRWSTGELPTDYGFTGQQDVSSVGLVYMRARFYHAGLGRFVSADTIVPDVNKPEYLNRYCYSVNSPLVYLDPTGHNPVPPVVEGIIKGYEVLQTYEIDRLWTVRIVQLSYRGKLISSEGLTARFENPYVSCEVGLQLGGRVEVGESTVFRLDQSLVTIREPQGYLEGNFDYRTAEFNLTAKSGPHTVGLGPGAGLSTRLKSSVGGGLVPPLNYAIKGANIAEVEVEGPVWGSPVAVKFEPAMTYKATFHGGPAVATTIVAGAVALPTMWPMGVVMFEGWMGTGAASSTAW
ncbi:MAG: RHS repeat-associated core domain-containing protein, partial [Chloroflexi bacterium]|nr:RHS repeat-associated core domain-containing protein [Chloroflexota bacterium]